MKKQTTTLLTLLLMIYFVLVGCNHSQELPSSVPPVVPESTGSTPFSEPKIVAIAMPNNLQSWGLESSLMRRQLESDGFTVDLRYADNDVETQKSQLEEMIAAGCDVLLITAIDGASLTEVLTRAKGKGILVIAYGRLILETDATSYYVTVDYTEIGDVHGTYIEEKLSLETSPRSLNIELFSGAPNDSGSLSKHLLNDLLDFLQPYLDSGQVAIPSGQVEIQDAGIQGYETGAAQERMESLIASQGYGPNGTRLDAVICASDSIALGVTQALLDAGYTADNFPIVTGWGCDLESVRNIIRGTQSMSIIEDSRKLADRAVEMTESILRGEEPEINTPDSYDNGVKIVPAYVCGFTIVTRENYKELLVDSGYYTEEEIAGLESGG